MARAIATDNDARASLLPRRARPYSWQSRPNANRGVVAHRMATPARRDTHRLSLRAVAEAENRAVKRMRLSSCEERALRAVMLIVIYPASRRCIDNWRRLVPAAPLHAPPFPTLSARGRHAGSVGQTTRVPLAYRSEPIETIPLHSVLDNRPIGFGTASPCGRPGPGVAHSTCPSEAVETRSILAREIPSPLKARRRPTCSRGI